jgi:hypothetical protein
MPQDFSVHLTQNRAGASLIPVVRLYHPSPRSTGSDAHKGQFFKDASCSMIIVLSIVFESPKSAFSLSRRFVQPLPRVRRWCIGITVARKMTPENKYLHYDNNHGRVSLMANKVCKRCGHKWQKRTAGKPVQCPKCHSVKWDVARKVKP